MSPSVTVLLVEDDDLVVQTFESALADNGYAVVIARNAASALAELEAGAERFRVLVTDIDLGSEVDGWQVAQRARELVPLIPVVYMSGESAHDWSSKGVPGSIMLAKPFALGQLATAVSTLATEANMRSPPAPG